MWSPATADSTYCCSTSWGYVQIDPRGTELLFQIITEREERASITKAPKFPDLVNRDFRASAPNVRWCGDITEIPTDEGKFYLYVLWNPSRTDLRVRNGF